jgi:uncharacterized repeat protein (TIGR03803 family)
LLNSLQQCVSKMRLGAASAALTLAVVLVSGIVSASSAQAQTFTDLYNFTGNPDGAYPYAGLIRDTAGNLYGTTLEGGSSNSGTVFKLDASGTETVLHNFAGGPSDGAYPYAAVVMDTKGNLYGTTYECGPSNDGTVYKLSSTRKETVLHNFAGAPSDGANPFLSNLFMDTKGNLYGVTEEGGSSSEGVVYKLSKSGTLTVLHSFAGTSSDGCYPLGTPAIDTDGNLYGTTEACGASEAGIVWKVSKKKTETVLHNFAGGLLDGEYPFAGVIMDAKGNLYGVTEMGGASSFGTVYELSKKGGLTLLHSFTGSDGEYPIGGVIRDAKDNLYGTTLDGGTGGYGTVWTSTK